MTSARRITKQLKARLKEYPIVVLTGPRQSGKTTLLKSEFPDWRYINLETPELKEFALQDPKGFLAEYDRYVILDEIQSLPNLFSYLQVLVDKTGKMGQFILSGSQNFNLMESVTQSLAGRVALLTLFPYDFQELKAADLWPDNLNRLITTGFYPAIYDRKASPSIYHKNYLATYVRRDITQLVNIQNLSQFNKFLKLCAQRAGQLLNYNDLAKDTGISHSTARNWLSLLETSYVIFQLSPYHKSYNKRLIKSPKIYFYDTGLLCHLLNIKPDQFNKTHKLFGHIFENLIVSEMYKRNAHNDGTEELYFWRDSHGHEVDLIKIDASMQVYEIKSSTTISSSNLSGLKRFESISEENPQLELIYGGTKSQKRNNIVISSWSDI